MGAHFPQTNQNPIFGNAGSFNLFSCIVAPEYIKSQSGRFFLEFAPKKKTSEQLRELWVEIRESVSGIIDRTSLK